MISRSLGIVLVMLSISILEIDTYAFPGMNDEDSIEVTEPNIRPTILWGIAQLVPSPQWMASKGEGLRFGMRWQITPLLYSFGINRRMSPWRTLIVEPLVRQSGSFELFLSPEYWNLSERYKSRWLFRTGLRAYFPLLEHGEYLSWSFGASYFLFDEIQGLSLEGGIYLFAGILGIQTSYSSNMNDAHWIFTLRIRYF